jgi:hypothetical protein
MAVPFPLSSGDLLMDHWDLVWAELNKDFPFEMADLSFWIDP